MPQCTEAIRHFMLVFPLIFYASVGCSYRDKVHALMLPADDSCHYGSFYSRFCDASKASLPTNNCIFGVRFLIQTEGLRIEDVVCFTLYRLKSIVICYIRLYE